ncbi:MAG: SAM-dependent methyltransferase [Planctomycetota bacterium]
MASQDAPDTNPYVSRGGLKLAAALDSIGIDPSGLVCADLGCSTGGYTDCLLQRGATRVYAVDTAYGELAWKLRNDSRVVVMERTNALHADVPDDDTVSLVALDLGWTKLSKAVPAAARWLTKGGVILPLIKPQYERPQEGGRNADRRTLTDEETETISFACVEDLREMGYDAADPVACPIRGGAKKKGGKGGGNLEWLTVIRVPADS